MWCHAKTSSKNTCNRAEVIKEMLYKNMCVEKSTAALIIYLICINTNQLKIKVAILVASTCF